MIRAIATAIAKLAAPNTKEVIRQRLAKSNAIDIGTIPVGMR